MKAEEWKKKIIAHTQMEREIRSDVARVYYVPMGEMPICTAIIFTQGDNGAVQVRAAQGYYGTDAHHANYINVVDHLDAVTMKALAMCKLEVARWISGQRDELPTAEELGLIDAKDDLPKSRFLY